MNLYLYNANKTYVDILHPDYIFINDVDITIQFLQFIGLTPKNCIINLSGNCNLNDNIECAYRNFIGDIIPQPSIASYQYFDNIMYKIDKYKNIENYYNEKFKGFMVGGSMCDTECMIPVGSGKILNLNDKTLKYYWCHDKFFYKYWPYNFNMANGFDDDKNLITYNFMKKIYFIFVNKYVNIIKYLFNDAEIYTSFPQSFLEPDYHNTSMMMYDTAGDLYKLLYNNVDHNIYSALFNESFLNRDAELNRINEISILNEQFGFNNKMIVNSYNTRNFLNEIGDTIINYKFGGIMISDCSDLYDFDIKDICNRIDYIRWIN